MSGSAIPAEAIEEAAKAMFAMVHDVNDWASVPDWIQSQYREEATKALEAALPHILAPFTPAIRSEWGTDYWGVIESEPTEAHARKVSSVPGVTLFRRALGGEWEPASWADKHNAKTHEEDRP